MRPVSLPSRTVVESRGSACLAAGESTFKHVLSRERILPMGGGISPYSHLEDGNRVSCTVEDEVYSRALIFLKHYRQYFFPSSPQHVFFYYTGRARTRNDRQ